MADNVSQLKEELITNSGKKIILSNPLNENFEINYLGQPLIIPAHEVKEFDYYPGLHVKKHLANFIYQKRELSKTDYSHAISEIEKEIDVTNG